MRRPLLVLLVLLAAGGAACGGDGDGSGGSEENVVVGPADEGIEGVDAVRVPDNDHTEEAVEYGLEPPAGGKHHPVWVNCGFYDQPFDDEHIVHDLEHGAVWLAYAPELTAADVEVVHQLARDHKVIAAPYPGLAADEAVVATAWARQLRLDSVDDPRLAAFVAEYEDGPQAPEAGVPCTGTPLGQPIP